MKNINYRLLVVVLTFTGPGCASLSNREKSMIAIAGAGLVGGVVGYATTPKGTYPMGHAALWSGVSAAGASVASLFIFDEQKRANELERQNTTLKKEIEAFQTDASGSEPELVSEISANSGKQIPKEISGIVKPGKWQLYKLNQWKSAGDNTLVHEDRMFKLVPPYINPGGLTQPSGEGKPE